MQLLLCLLVATVLPATSEPRHADDTIFTTDFEELADINFDQWPDEWTRRRGVEYPEYLKIEIVADPTPLPDSRHCLRMELNGGAATAYSPPQKISPLFSYRLEGYVKTEQLVNNVAYFSVTFYDANRKHTETHRSKSLCSVPSWQPISIGPVTPSRADYTYAVVGLHLAPTEKRDLFGAAMFDRLRLTRVPRMSLRTNHENNLFLDTSQIEVTCDMSGIQWAGTRIVFELLDVNGRELDSSEALLSDYVSRDPADATDKSGLSGSVHQLAKFSGFTGSITWRPHVPGYGFYQVRVSMRQDSDIDFGQNMPIVITRPAREAGESEFGWSLPRGTDPLPMKQLVPLIKQAGVGWVKYPAWFGENDLQTADDLAWFADRLGADGIEMVGMLDQPPSDVREKMGSRTTLSVAEVFLEPAVWRKALDRIMLRLSLKVRWWQLGADDDGSFVGLPDLSNKLGEIRKYIRQFSQDIQLGLAWNWLIEFPDTNTTSVDYLAMLSEPSFTAAELGRYIETSRQAQLHRWVTLRPLPAGKYGTVTRSADLVRRMLAAKMSQAEVIFLADPFDPSTGILNANGAPNELFPTWCVATRLIGGAVYLGSMQLPNRSTNRVFTLGDSTFMIVWNETPTTETLYLGEDVGQIDLWGHETPVMRTDTPAGPKHHLEVTAVPTFVVGLHPAITKWRLDCGFQRDRLQSVFGHAQNCVVRLKNTFPKGVRGEFRLTVPSAWGMPYREAMFKMAANEQLERSFEVMLHTDANSGPQPVQIAFDVMADQRYQFSVFRDLKVGSSEIDIQFNTWLDEQDRLIVEEQFTNKSDRKVSFNCLLFAPQRRRMSRQIFELMPGRATTTFVLPRGKELIGKTLWVRAEEIGGPRLLNYTVTAEP